MITDKMRILPGNPHGVEIAKAYLHAVEGDDIAGLKRLMKPDVTLSHANYPPVQGRDETVDMIQGYRQIVERIEFEVWTVFGSDDLIAIEKVNVAAIGGAVARVPTLTILQFADDGLIYAIRIYADIADLFRKLESKGAPVVRP